jgi:hypothetical protein
MSIGSKRTAFAIFFSINFKELVYKLHFLPLMLWVFWVSAYLEQDLASISLQNENSYFML